MNKIDYDTTKTIYQTTIPVLVNHINYGNHLGHDSLLSIVQEARLCWLKSHGMSEISLDGSIGLQLINLCVEYKSEAFHGDQLDIHLYIAESTKKTFSLLYQVINQRTNKIVALVNTGQIIFDFQLKKVVTMPIVFSEIIQK